MDKGNLYMMKQPELGKKIFEIRKEQGLTQEELVKKCNINVRTIQRIEAGEVNPRSYTVKSIIGALGLDNNLFFNKKEQNISDLTKGEKNVISTSWIIGIFFFSINVVGIVLDRTFLSRNGSLLNNLYFSIPFGIVYITTLTIFLKGYKLLGKNNNNVLLVNAVYFFITISTIMILLRISISTFDLNEFLGYIMFVIFGLGEILMGFGILKLKKIFGDFAKTVGIIKVANGIIYLTIILAPIAWFLTFPIMLLEIFFLYSITKNKSSSYYS